MAKSKKLMVGIHNIETGEIIIREMNDDEYAQNQESIALAIAEKTEAESKATRRQEILDKLGLTNDEAQLLLG